VFSLRKMVDHIYGRTKIMDDVYRPNMFIAELDLYINFAKEQLANEASGELDVKRKKYYVEYFKNLGEGITYYKNLPHHVEPNYATFSDALNLAEYAIGELEIQYSINPIGNTLML